MGFRSLNQQLFVRITKSQLHNSSKFSSTQIRWLSSTESITDNTINQNITIETPSFRSTLVQPTFENYNVDLSFGGVKRLYNYFHDWVIYGEHSLGSSYTEYFDLSDSNAFLYMIPTTLALSMLCNLYLSFKNVGNEQQLFMNITERNKLSQLLKIVSNTQSQLNSGEVTSQKDQIEQKLVEQLRKKMKFERLRIFPYIASYLWMGCLPPNVSAISHNLPDSWLNYLWFDDLNSTDPFFILPFIHSTLLFLILKNYNREKRLNIETHAPSAKHLWVAVPYLTLFFHTFSCATEFAFIITLLSNITVSKTLKYFRLSKKQNLKCENTFNSAVVGDFFDKMERERKESILNFEDAFINPKLYPGKKLKHEKIISKLNKFIKKTRAYRHK